MSETPALAKDIWDVMANLEPIDSGLLEMLPAQTAEFLRQCPKLAEEGRREIAACRARNAALADQLTELNAALQEYAVQSGGGQIMLQNYRLCIEQIRMRKTQGRT